MLHLHKASRCQAPNTDDCTRNILDTKYTVETTLHSASWRLKDTVYTYMNSLCIKLLVHTHTHTDMHACTYMHTHT